MDFSFDHHPFIYRIAINFESCVWQTAQTDTTHIDFFFFHFLLKSPQFSTKFSLFSPILEIFLYFCFFFLLFSYMVPHTIVNFLVLWFSIFAFAIVCFYVQIKTKSINFKWSKLVHKRLTKLWKKVTTTLRWAVFLHKFNSNPLFCIDFRLIQIATSKPYEYLKGKFHLWQFERTILSFGEDFLMITLLLLRLKWNLHTVTGSPS